jgi:hypothetical protein
VRWTVQPNRRCRGKATRNRVFVNSLREVLGLDVLYPAGEQADAERFYIPSHTTKNPRTMVPRGTS